MLQAPPFLLLLSLATVAADVVFLNGKIAATVRAAPQNVRYSGSTVKFEIEVDVAAEAVDKKQFEEHLRKEAILALFADGKIPAGQATREPGLTRVAFLELLQQRGIPCIDYTFQDWQEDQKTIDKLWPEIEKNVKESGGRRLK